MSVLEPKRPWDWLPRREANTLRDLAGVLPCYSQTANGWYTDSCYEAHAKRKCHNCLILQRVHKLIVAGLEVSS